MTKTPKILAFAGSLRKDSFNKKMIAVAAEGARAAGAEVTLIDLLDFEIPIYNGDIETESGLPENAKKLQKLMLEYDGFLIATPEYNSSISGVLKNTIDWTSRPSDVAKGGECYAGKAAMLMSASPGALGGLRGLFDVRKILSTMGVIVLPGEFALGKAHEAFDEKNAPNDDAPKAKIENLGKTLAEFIAKNY